MLASTTTHRQRLSELATRFAVDETRIRTICLEWGKLNEVGAPIAISITGLNLFTIRPAWADLGIDEDDPRVGRMSTGIAKLFPVDVVNKLKSLEARFRYWLDKMSFKVAVYAPYRYMLHKTWNAWCQKEQELRQEWDRTLDALLREAAPGESEDDTPYGQALARLVSDYATIASSAYEQLCTAKRSRGVVWDKSYASFLQEMIDRVTRSFPSREQLRKHLKVEVTLGLLLNPKDVERVLLEAEEIQYEREERALIHQLQVERIRERFMELASPMVEVVDSFFAHLYREAIAIASVLDEQGMIPAKTVGRIHALRGSYQLYSLVEDGPIEAALDAISRAMVKQPPRRLEATAKKTKYDVGEVRRSLASLARATRRSARIMAQLHPDEWGSVDLGDD